MEQQLESLVRCSHGGGAQLRVKAGQLLRGLGFTMRDGEYWPPKGRKVMAFGEEIVSANNVLGVTVLLKSRKFDAIAKRLGFTKRELREEEYETFYARDLTPKTRFIMMKDVGPDEKRVGTQVSCYSEI